MKKKQVIYATTSFFSGGIIVIVVFAILAVVFVRGKPIPLVKPRTFGDITIWVEKIPSIKEGKTYDISKAMFIAKDGISFFTLYQNKDGEIARACLLRENMPILSFESVNESGKWEDLIYYGYNKEADDVGEMYIDNNFDGIFDKKIVISAEGEKAKKYIYLEGLWKQVRFTGVNKAVSKEREYFFDVNSGWKVNDVNDIKNL